MVARVDGATYAVDGPTQFGTGGPLQVLTGRSRAFIIDAATRTADVVDAGSLTKKDTVDLGVSPGADRRSSTGPAGCGPWTPRTDAS